jgi:hypothetical protein
MQWLKNILAKLGEAIGIDFGEWDKGADLFSYIKEVSRVLTKDGSFVVFNDWKNLGDIARPKMKVIFFQNQENLNFFIKHNLQINNYVICSLFFRRSFIIIADKTSTIIGVETIITAAEIGEVRLNPLKKVSILNATPKKAAAIILGKSPMAIFSLGIKSHVSQKSSTEPPTRRKINPKASM